MAPESLCVALEAAGQTMFEYHPAAEHLSWADSAAARALLGVDGEVEPGLDDLIGRICNADLVRREQVLAESREDRSSYQIEYRLGDGPDAPWLEERGTWMPSADGDFLIAVLRRIDDQKQREAALDAMASHDELTGQLNRARFMELSQAAVNGTHNGTRTGALLFVGIDDVGAINNDFGFDAADQVIVEVADRISRSIEADDFAGRVAGTKFAVMLADGEPETVRARARRILNAMRERLVETRAGGINISVCVGATPVDEQTVSATDALARAEAAFDQARRKGPSSFESFSEHTETVTQRRKNTELTDAILTALNDRRVYLAYQPIVEDVTDTPTKFECLIRMRAEDGSEIPAPAFIPAAEKLGLVHLLDRRVLELALRDLRERDDIRLNVNLSPETLGDPVWAEGYLSHLRGNAAVTDRLTIELTETQMVDAVEETAEFVSAIKALGCEFAIDDFGAGYTSFRNLKAMDIDVLKIDGSFIAGVSNSRENQLFVRTLLDLARNFGMKAVAEWVDNEIDAQLLKALGIDYLQGFFIGKPGALPARANEDDDRDERQTATG